MELTIFFRQPLFRSSNISLPAAFAGRDVSNLHAWLYALVGFLFFGRKSDLGKNNA